jgi:hypothetical protein
MDDKSQQAAQVRVGTNVVLREDRTLDGDWKLVTERLANDVCRFTLVDPEDRHDETANTYPGGGAYIEHETLDTAEEATRGELLTVHQAQARAGLYSVVADDMRRRAGVST